MTNGEIIFPINIKNLSAWLFCIYIDQFTRCQIDMYYFYVSCIEGRYEDILYEKSCSIIVHVFFIDQYKCGLSFLRLHSAESGQTAKTCIGCAQSVFNVQSTSKINWATRNLVESSKKEFYIELRHPLIIYLVILPWVNYLLNSVTIVYLYMTD